MPNRSPSARAVNPLVIALLLVALAMLVYGVAL